MVQEELKKMIFEEALAQGLDRKDAEKVAERAFVRWTELIQAEVPNRNTQFKSHLGDERLLALLSRAVDEVWENLTTVKEGDT